MESNQGRRHRRRNFDRRDRPRAAGRCSSGDFERPHPSGRQARRRHDSARCRSDRCQGQKHSPRFDRRPLPLPRLDGRSLSRLWRGHLSEYFQQSGGMDHCPARGREKRQYPWSARVGFREHYRRAAARGHRHARRQRTSIIVDSEDEARKAVRDLVEKGSMASNYSSG